MAHELDAEAPIPRDHSPFVNPSTDQATPSAGSSETPTLNETPNPITTAVSTRPKRQGAQKEPGHYKKLHRGLANLYLVEERQEPPIEYCLSALKVDHVLSTVSTNRTIPKNYKEAKRLPNYEQYWHPAMVKQGKGLKEKEVYTWVKRHKAAKILPGK